jgi:NAD(P)-dependent dehydrogenase (short-subunit alcohol dehydrogenase family)
MRFDGKVAVVMRGGSGMGTATAVRLANERATVIAAEINGLMLPVDDGWLNCGRRLIGRPVWLLN